MIQIKPLVLTVLALLVTTFMIPTVLVLPFMEKQTEKQTTPSVQDVAITNEQPSLEVAVYRSQEKKVDHLPLEKYVMGVVASEMPAEYKMEALKAQALSARTYIVKQLMNDKGINVPKGAAVTDTVMHQVYKSPAELQNIWGPEYKWKMSRIQEAVQATAGQIITYNGKPITASFFSTSNGYTENSEDYWTNPFPYLRSVESPWDKSSPKYLEKKVIPIQELENKLNVNINNNQVAEVIKRTEGNRIAKVKIGDQTFEGREVREKLGLNSSDFSFTRDGNNIIATTKGWGHGVGMSQYGAHGMASEGKTVHDIITHYYTGTQITEVDPFISKIKSKGKGKVAAK